MVDWGAILADAEDSPRGLLAELLARADDIKELVVVFVTLDGEAEQTNTWQSTRHQAMTIAMLEYAKWHQCQLMYDAAQGG